MVLELIFQPFRATKHQFSLPIHIMGIAEVDDHIFVECEGLPSPITLSKTEISFKNKVLHRNANGVVVSHFGQLSKDEIVFTNALKNPILWKAQIVDLSEGGSEYFSVEPKQGSLVGGENQQLLIYFEPNSPGYFEALVKISIGYHDVRADFTLKLQGSSVDPLILFDPPEIFLPIVPLGEESSAVFSIINYGCERTDVKHTILVDNQDHDGSLELVFPEGKLLKNEGERLTVVARFIPSPNRLSNGKLNKPISFTTRIQFSEPGRPNFYLQVHATTDCCPLTLQSYIWMNSHEFGYDLKENGVFYKRLVNAKRLDENQKR